MPTIENSWTNTTRGGNLPVAPGVLQASTVLSYHKHTDPYVRWLISQLPQRLYINHG